MRDLLGGRTDWFGHGCGIEVIKPEIFRTRMTSSPEEIYKKINKDPKVFGKPLHGFFKT